MGSLIVFLAVFGGAGFVVFISLLLKTMVTPKKFSVIEEELKKGDTKPALRHAKALLARNEKNPDAHWYLGECYLAEGRPDLAVAEYRYIVNTGKFTPIATEVKVRERLADAYYKLGQLDESQKEWILLTKIDPQNFHYHYQVAKLFEERNYTDSALRNYKKVITINPQHADSYFRIGVILYKKRVFPEAKKAFITALKYDQQNYKSYYYLGLISKALGDTASALTQFEKAMKDQEVKQRCLFERGSIFAIKGNIEKAIQELERAEKLGEEDLPVIQAIRYLLAKCYETNRNLERAVALWEKIYKKNPKYKDVAEKLAMYSELRTDDRLKDFITANNAKFQKYCEELVKFMGLEVQDVFLRDSELVELNALETQSKWRNAKKAPTIVKIFRSPDPIGYDVIRSLYDQMRRDNAMRGICVTASRFTKSAVEFAQIRPIDLIDKEELTKLLHNIPA